MPIVARRPQKSYSTAPEGLHQAVCCDVWEPWTAESKFTPGKLQEKIRIVWQLDVIDEKTGRPHEVSQIYTFSLHERSTLSKHLEQWRNKKFTDEERDGFDIEKLIGVNCQIQVIHSAPKENGDVYANVQAVVPLGKGMPQMVVSKDFVRHKDRADASSEDMKRIADDNDEEAGVPF